MISRRFHRVSVLLLVGVTGLGLSGCSHTTTDAATITYHDGSGSHAIHITRSDFLDQLGALVGNQKFQDLLKTNGFKLVGDQENTTGSNVSAQYLSQLVEESAIDAEFATHDLQVTAKNRADALADQKTNFGAEVFASFPASLQNSLVEHGARAHAVADYYGAMSDAKEQALYDEFASTICPSGKLVAHILVKTEAGAAAILDQIKGGASFATLARTKSTDTGSAKNGGDLGCLRTGSFVKEFETAAFAAPFDTPTGPVKSQFGYHVIVVTHATYAAIRAQLAQALQQNATSIVRNLRLQEMKVWINPQFGTGALGVDSQQNQLVYQVTPPAPPAVRTAREKSPTTTTTAVATAPPSGG